MITNQYKLIDRLGQFATTTGRAPLNINTGAVLTGLDLRLQYTITTGATAPTGAMFGPILQLAQVLQRLEIIVNGQDTVFTVQPWLYIARLIYERHGVLPRGFETPINMAANQTTNVDITIPLHFDLLRGRKRNDCGIDLRGIRAAQLYATWGGLANLFNVPGATVTLTNLALTVEATYIEQVPARDKNNRPIAFAVRQVDEVNQQILGASNQFTLDIDQRTGVNLVSMAIFFDTLTGGVHGGDDTGLINGTTFQGDIKLKSGGTLFFVGQAALIKARVRDEFFIPPPITTVAGNTIGELPGMFMLDLRYDGKLSTGIPTGALDANLQLLLNQNYATGNTTVFVQRESVRPLNVGP